MAVKKLSSNIQRLFSCSANLFSYKRAVEELVYNALDAQSTSIAIRIHIQENKIQVVDNGCGIAKEDFELLGQKYATSKFVDLSRYKSAPNSYGFRGQSLASLVEVSKSIKITARVSNTEETWTKVFYKGKGKESTKTTTRPSKGTTVDVNAFLYNLNIQKKSINPVNEINNIKTLLEQLSLVHNNVSFTLRDDSRNEIIFKAHKTLDIIQKFKSLFDIEKSDIQELQVEKNEYKAVAYVAKNNDHPDRHHWIFLNKKYTSNTKLHKLVYDTMTKSLNPSSRITKVKKSKNLNDDEDCELPKNHISFYFIFITCPYYDYDISNTPRQSTLEFKNWTYITKLVEKLVKFHTGELKVKKIKKCGRMENNIMLKNGNEGDDTRQRVGEIMKKILGTNTKKVSVSQMQNGIKGKLIKRMKKVPKLNPLKVVPPTEPATTKGKNIIADQIILDKRPDDIFEKTKPSHKTTKVHHNKSKDKTFLKDKKQTRQTKPLAKINKKMKMKKKHKKDSLIEIFRNQPDLVVERCNLLAQKVKKLLPCDINRQQRVFINETVNYSSIIKDNKNISVRKRVGEIIIHDYFPIKRKEKPHSGNRNSFKDIREDYLKTSYDLLKTIIGTKTANTQNTLPTGEFNDFREKFLEQYEIKLPQLTYQSHQYISNYTTSHHYENNEKIFAQKNNFHHQNKKGNYIITQRFNNFKNNMIDPTPPIQSYRKKNNCDLNIRQVKNIKPKKVHTFDKSKWTTKQFNIRSFSENFTSHTIEFSDSKKDNTNTHKNNYSEINADRTYDISSIPKYIQPQSNVVETSTIGFTYTITSSHKTSESRIDSQANEYCSSDWTSRLIYSKTQTVFASKKHDPTADQLNVIFISNSNDPDKEKTNNEIDPLNICETILHSSNELKTGSDNNNNQNQLNDSLFNLISKDFSPNVRNIDTIENTQQLLRSPSSVERAIVDFKNQEETNKEKKIGDSVERVDIDKIVSNNKEKTICNTEELGESAFVANDFDIRNRLRFVPKGMSPIFENRCMKTKNDTNLESGYFADDLYSKFRDEVQTHTEVYEAHVQNPQDFVSKNIIKVNNRLDKDNSSLTFDAKSIKEAKVLGQIDNKFIASIIKGKSDQSEFLVLFDQHAVHERIRLEENLADYFKNNAWRTVKLDDVLLKLSKDDILYLHNYKDKFTQFGLDWTILNNCSITLHGIPAAILGKNPRQVEKVISAVKNLISEEINMIRSQKGCVSLYPKSITDLVFSEACRYAIKFGVRLPQSECVELIQALSTCKTPFQCAHGRPVMAVILDIKPEIRNYKFNMGKIRQLKTGFKHF